MKIWGCKLVDLLWNKTGLTGPDEDVMAFLAGEDVVLDRELLLFDLQASAAHANGLCSIGILSADENKQLQQALQTLGDEYRAGDRVLDSRYEDCHSAIEAWLTEMLGQLGTRIHAGRSRNDQVAVALRLYMRQGLSQLKSLSADIAHACLDRAQAESDLAIPGHTHLQKAMPSSAGLWLAGHAEAFIDNAALAEQMSVQLNACPLGTASGFGINLPLAREQVAQELGFSRLVINPQYAQNSRGKAELLTLSALAAATLDLRRLAWDFSLFTTQEFNYLGMPQRYRTGSSIMPNKSNPDVVELLRATHAVVVGAQLELNEVLALPSGYHRDLQATKPPLMRAMSRTLQALNLLPQIISGFVWNKKQLQASITPEMYATDYATRLTSEGLPFREAYRQVADSLAQMTSVDAQKSLADRTSPGGCGALMLEQMRERLAGIEGPTEK